MALTPESLFSLANGLALTGWLALLLFPLQPRFARFYAGRLLPVLLAGLYAALILSYWSTTTGGFSDLDAVARLFDNRFLLLAGWVHYLAFDLFVGAWIVAEARTRGVPHLIVIPCLILTFLFGPAGLLLFLSLSVARRLTRASRPLTESPAS